MRLELTARLALTCKVCDQVLPDEQDRTDAMAMIKLFGVADGWHVCPCLRFVWRGWRKRKREYLPILSGADWEWRKRQ